MPKNSITVTVKLFAAFQETVGVPELVLELPPHTPVVAVGEHLWQAYPPLRQWQGLTRYGVNLQFVSPETLLQDGDEVVLIPPVSGG